MLTLGALTFAVPLALLAIILVPALWWLLRMTPPAPLTVRFPPVRLLAGLAATEESVRPTPIWLLILRLLLVLAAILAAAHPLLNAPDRLPGSGPLILVIDDGWAAATAWAERQHYAESLIDRADREGRPVVLVTTAPSAEERTAAPAALPAAAARERLRALQPKPWPTRRDDAIDRLLGEDRLRAAAPGVVYWLSDGLAEDGPVTGIEGHAAALRQLGAVSVALPEPAQLPAVLRPPSRRGEQIGLRVDGIAGGGEASVSAIGDDGTVLARLPARGTGDDGALAAVVELPAELRQRLARFAISGETTAAAVVVADDRWRRRPVGLVAGEGGRAELPLLSELYYLERAFERLAEVRRGRVEALLARDLAVLVITGGSVGATEDRDRIAAWVEQGGILVRFAGSGFERPRTDDDPLLPVRLRDGDRVMGGSLAWRRPAHLAPFAGGTPFTGLAVAGEIEVRRQVLAEPTVDLADRTWARLDDGTPLVTARPRGQGWVVLFHVTANAVWSNLPLSGLFVDMLDRIVTLSQGSIAAAGNALLPPLELLDGFGRPAAPSAGTEAISDDPSQAPLIGPRHPPGLYGDGNRRQALNLGAQIGEPRPLAATPAGVERLAYRRATEADLRPWLLATVMLLGLVDLIASLFMRGLLRTPAVRRAAAAALAVAVLGQARPVMAQTIIADGSSPAPALATSLAYIVTGDAAVDKISRAGLVGLSLIVNRRTAAELAPPVGVDPDRDELAFFPLLYWPLTGDGRLPSPPAVEALRSFRMRGGTIVFDVRDRSGRRHAELRSLARALELPALVPVPPDHVLGRAFYLLRSFPGRWTGSTVWVEGIAEHVNDGVSSLVVGEDDWAGAWAVDDLERPMFAVVPGGERQRELAYRTGVNLVMYVLTGSYKADQVHAPAILERLSR